MPANSETTSIVLTEEKIRKLLAGQHTSSGGKKDVDGVANFRYIVESDPLVGPWGKATAIFQEKLALPRFATIFSDNTVIEGNFFAKLTPYFCKSMGAKGEKWQHKIITMGDVKKYVSDMLMVRELVENNKSTLATIIEKDVVIEKAVDVVKQYSEEYHADLITLDDLKAEVEAGRLTEDQLKAITAK